MSSTKRDKLALLLPSESSALSLSVLSTRIMTTKLDALAASVQAAVQTMVDCKTIPSESVSAIWGDTDHKELEPMLLGSLLKFGPVGQASEFYAAVSTTGEVVFGTGDRAKLALSKSGSTGPTLVAHACACPRPRVV